MIKKILILFLFGFLYILILCLTVVGAYFLAFRGKIYPGVTIDGQNVGNWTKTEVIDYLNKINEPLERAKFIFNWEEKIWETTGKELGYQYKMEETAERAFSFGRQRPIINNLPMLWKAFQKTYPTEAEYTLGKEKLAAYLEEISKSINIDPIEGLYKFKEGKITAFKLSADGRSLDVSLTISLVEKNLATLPSRVIIELPIKVLKPKVTEETDKLGIVELIGKGESYFRDSISTRVYNISLGSSKFHGLLIPPGEIFSFNDKIGTISAYTGYKQAYVIEKGKTVLGDGGGVCQVSTTLYRAALYAGLPIVERVAHAYRVGYYEPPVGLDATVYDPSPNFRFKNDTGKYILIQVNFDEINQKLTFELYGTNDGRVTTISRPVIVSTAPAPSPKYQDDPTLPKGTEKQIDTAHAGAKVYFTRKVVKNGVDLINETVWSSYIPWAAVIMRGTKE